ncbi:MAG: tail fiber assembly protein [Bacteroidota bacterium]
MIIKIGKPIPEALATKARTKRDGLLTQSDYSQLADSPHDKQAWATYRQALRDITVQAGFPDNITWPQEPTP